MPIVKILRSTIPGHAPSGLVSGQISINEADGVLFWLDGNDGTTIRSFNFRNPVAPTPLGSDSSTKVATTAFVQAIAAAVVGLAPGNLNTLAEIATAINNDPAFYRTINNTFAGCLRFDQPQTLNLAQLSQVNSNLSGVTSGLLMAGHGQCKLTCINSGLIKLSPQDGNLLVVNDQRCTIPDAGVLMSNTGLTANTGYYIFASAVGGVVNALLPVPAGAGHQVRAGTGVVVDSSVNLTLVGLLYTTLIGAAFKDDTTGRWVLSYFNRRPKTAVVAVGNVSTPSPSPVQLGSGLVALNWADEETSAILTLEAGTTGSFGEIFIGVDGASTAIGDPIFVYGQPGAGNFYPISQTGRGGPVAEGAHGYNLCGAANSGTGTLFIFNANLRVTTNG